MSWFWGKKQTDDPTKSLDNDLKQFLDSQQPKPYIPAERPAETAKQQVTPKNQVPQTPVDPEQKQLPAESLFQDGRYKHLWKTYVPQRDLVEPDSTPAQRLLNASKDRKSTLSEAALENCAFEEELKRTCFEEGDAFNRIRARLTMCSRETKAFNRCFQLQAKFLQALGYRSSAFSSQEEDETIQMHADKLYHRMMDYEAAVDAAKAKGEPIPPLTSIFNPNRPAPTLEEINLPPALAKGLTKPLTELPAHEREVAARAVLEETKVAQSHAEDFFKYTTTLNEDRQERQKKLINMFGDTLGKFFIPDAPDQDEMPKLDTTNLDREFWRNDPPIRKAIPNSSNER